MNAVRCVMGEQKKRKKQFMFAEVLPWRTTGWLAVRTQPPHGTNTSAILNTSAIQSTADTGGFQRGDVTGVLANVDAVILGRGVAVGEGPADQPPCQEVMAVPVAR